MVQNFRHLYTGRHSSKMVFRTVQNMHSVKKEKFRIFTKTLLNILIYYIKENKNSIADVRMYK